jgi:hypothetical protein
MEALNDSVRESSESVRLCADSRRIRAPEKVAELLAGTRYQDGIQVPDDPPEKQWEAA